MIEESYVSFDIAKMLKEVGFNVPCNSYYSNDCIITAFAEGNFNEYEPDISRPTQALGYPSLQTNHTRTMKVKNKQAKIPFEYYLTPVFIDLIIYFIHLQTIKYYIK